MAISGVGAGMFDRLASDAAAAGVGLMRGRLSELEGRGFVREHEQTVLDRGGLIPGRPAGVSADRWAGGLVRE